MLSISRSHLACCIVYFTYCSMLVFGVSVAVIAWSTYCVIVCIQLPWLPCLLKPYLLSLCSDNNTASFVYMASVCGFLRVCGFH